MPHHRSRPRLRFALVAVGAATSLVLTPLPHAFAAPGPDTAAAADGAAGAVISEVYGGGGNSGAALVRDFVELGNPGSDSFDLSGHSVQYLPGSPGASSRWQATALSGSVEPGSLYLVAQAAGSGGTTQLPEPDASGSIAMSATTGTVALVSGTTPLTCKTAADCAEDDRIVDLVGYGGAVVREGASTAAGAGNSTSVFRDEALTDTDDNGADFRSGAPTPVNSAGEGVDDGDDGDDEEEPGEPPEAGEVRVHHIQGTTRWSPLAGEQVTHVPGIVTGVRASGSRGYWIQDAEGDGDPRTSEGVFVYTGSAAPTVSVGDDVLVSGQVSEYYPATGAQSITQITSPRAVVVSRGNDLPAPVVLDADSVPDLYSPEAGGGSVNDLELEPDKFALDFLESVEGQRVEINDTRVISRTTDYDEIWVTVKPEENPSARGGTVYGSYDEPNTGRLKVMSLDSAALPAANTGDVLAGSTVGPLDYAQFGGYTLQATELGSRVDNGLTRPEARPQEDAELAIATYNVENLAATDPDAKFTALAEGVAVGLASPDILALEEIQDDNGPVNDGTVTAEATLAKFADAIVSAGGPRYEWRTIDPENNRDGGQPGGNIRNVFFFNPDRVSFTDREGGDATSAVEVVEGTEGPELSFSPGRISPGSDAWASSRKPLTGEFVFGGETYFLITNHFNSKGGDQSLHGRFQPPQRTSEAQRHRQAQEVADFIGELHAADPDARVVNLGDFNDFEFSRTLEILGVDGQMNNLLLTLPPDQRYTYIFDGNSQSLDNIMMSSTITEFEYEVLHIHTEFAEQASDHDPQVVRIDTSGQGDGDGDGGGDDGGSAKDRLKEKLREALRALEEWLRKLFGR
ncbi:endonuclease/exonuclease/phosphatase family protein [Streptomyces sp. SM14]|uniref:endonuclease/exonuclease/phosphatase family protein n=1 Tax=Streptomyces sp. SM14 TaxID=1736045 RepID=UPI0021563A12|nr:endonuclease/exonuclease/phosphatase family protein [Streptomyces sp. SM14]